MAARRVRSGSRTTLHQPCLRPAPSYVLGAAGHHLPAHCLGITVRLLSTLPVQYVALALTDRRVSSKHAVPLRG